jgi:RNA polymerase sigma-70 factor (ECF subfamily)
VTDDDLMTRYLQGDAAAFETLFARHHQAVYGLARRLLTRAEEAEDVMQEAFLRLARGASRYESRGLLRAYLLRIARNLSLDRLHRLERRPFEAAGTGRLTVLDLEGGEPAPPEWLEQRDRLRQLEQHLQGLPWRQREALLLHAQEGLTYREIAVVLEVPLGTVKTLIHRARGRLARALEAHLPEGRDAV